MGTLLAFAPFIVFAIVDRLIGSTAGLFAGAATSAALLLRDCLSDGRSPKVLEIGTFLLFADWRATRRSAIRAGRSSACACASMRACCWS
jgi:hypothetical protein